MGLTTVTRNNQITLTKDVREPLGIREGTPLVVWTEGDRIVIRKRDFAWLKTRKSVLPADMHVIVAKLRSEPYPRT